MSIRELPWWLGGGTEQCPVCLQRYAVEVEVRCVGCDRGLCAHCVARCHAHGEVWCPECAQDEAEAASA